MALEANPWAERSPEHCQNRFMDSPVWEMLDWRR